MSRVRGPSCSGSGSVIRTPLTRTSPIHRPRVPMNFGGSTAASRASFHARRFTDQSLPRSSGAGGDDTSQIPLGVDQATELDRHPPASAAEKLAGCLLPMGHESEEILWVEALLVSRRRCRS